MLRLIPAALMLGACASTSVQGDTLAGSQWQLLSIQSMDDAQGTTRVADPSHYTLSFGSDGRAALRLDCNRGTGSWQAEATSPTSGRLSFGMMATTRAMCMPGSLEPRLTRDLPNVRGYLRKDGKLYLTLQADGGIYEWAPLKP